MIINGREIKRVVTEEQKKELSAYQEEKDKFMQEYITCKVLDNLVEPLIDEVVRRMSTDV